MEIADNVLLKSESSAVYKKFLLNFVVETDM